MKIIVTTIAASAVLLGFSQAGTLIPPTIKHSPKQCFYAGETNFDIISLYVSPSGDPTEGYDGEPLDDGFGGGISISHFVTERFGGQFRAYWWDTESVVHSITGSFIVRQPIEKWCTAPYVFGGIGGHFDSANQHSWHAGAGVDIRLSEKWGIVADYSYTWADETADWNLFTLGLRFTF